MKVLTVIITPPTTRESGGFAAGMQLSTAISRVMPITVAVMSDETSATKLDTLQLLRFRCVSSVGLFSKFIPSQLRSLLWRSLELKNYIRNSRPEIVHFHNPHPAGALWQLCRFCYELGIPYVISGHGFVEMSNFSNALGLPVWQRPLVRGLITRPFENAVRRATHIFITSPFETPIVTKLGVKPESQTLVTNGVNHYYKEPAAPALCTSIVNRWGIRSDIPTFLFVGNQTANKGLGVLLDAAHLLTFQCRIIVAGRIRSIQEHSAMCTKHSLSTLGDMVVFTDAVSDEELRALYQSVDVFVFPSLSDTLPLVILEAMSSGLPVIASNVGGIPYQVTEETGILIPPGDPAVLAQAMETLALDPIRRKKMGVVAKARIDDCFDWDKSALLAISCYKKILSRQIL